MGHAMGEHDTTAWEIPERLADILERHDVETLLAIREYCDRLIDEGELEREFDERTM